MLDNKTVQFVVLKLIFTPNSLLQEFPMGLTWLSAQQIISRFLLYQLPKLLVTYIS